MKLELALSVLSKRETLLGVGIETHNGVTVDDGQLCEERLVEFKFGFVFFIIKLIFVTKGNKIDTPDMGKVMKAIKAFDTEFKKEIESENIDK